MGPHGQQASPKLVGPPLEMAGAGRLGTPINGGFLVTGSVNLSGGTGQANLAIHLQESKASSTPYVEARQSAGTWTNSTLTVRTDGAGEPINLLGTSL
jgi:hypothetical protein